MTSWQIAPVAERWALGNVEKRESNYRRLSVYYSDERAVNLAVGATLNPTLSAEALVGADAAGIAGEDPILQQLAAVEQDQSGVWGSMANIWDEAVWDPLKGATRWIGMGFEGLYDEVISRPMRTTANWISHGMNPVEAYRESGDAAFGAFGESIAKLSRGEDLNMGEGIFANSNLAPEVEMELARTNELAMTIGTPQDQITNTWGRQNYGANFAQLSPNQRQMIYLSQERDRILAETATPGTEMYSAQENLGDPYVNRIRAEAESVLWLADIPWNRGEAGLGVFTQVSPGRIFSTLAVEPGTRPYHYASGIIDAGLQIFADPADVGLAGAVAATRASRAVGITQEAAETMATSQRAADALRAQGVTGDIMEDAGRRIAIMDRARQDLVNIQTSGDLETFAAKADVSQAAGRIYAEAPPIETGARGGLNVRRAELQRLARQQVESERLTELINDLDNYPDLASQIKTQAGLLNTHPRTDVYGPQINQWITGRGARPFVENFTRATTQAEVDALLSHVKVPVPRRLRAGLVDADTNADVIGLLLPHVGGALTETGLAVVPSLTGGRLPAAMASVLRLNPFVQTRVSGALARSGVRINARQMYGQSRLARWFSHTAPSTLDLNDLDRSYDRLDLLAKNQKLERGFSAEIYSSAAGTTITKSVDDVFRDFAQLNDGDFVGAYGVLADYSSLAMANFMEGGLDKNVAREVTRFTDDLKEDALYFINRIGDTVREPYTTTKVTITGEDVPSIGHQLTTELFNNNVVLPDAGMIRRAAAETERLGRITNLIATQGADKLFEERVGFRALNAALTKAWKPLVLLRFAWPVRVVGEEQTRLAAAGLGSMFTISPGSGHHPLSYMAMVMADTKKFRVGDDLARRAMDVFGDDITQAEEFLSAMARRANFDGEMGARGARYWRVVHREGLGTYTEDYIDGLATELNQLWSDPVVRNLFQVEAADDVARIDAVTDWMLSGEGRRWTNELTRTAPQETRDLMRTREGMRAYLEGVYARSHLKAGGDYVYIKADGSAVSSAGVSRALTPEEAARWHGGEGYLVTRPGHDEVLSAYSDGVLGGLRVDHRLARDRELLAADPSLTDLNRVKGELRRLVTNEARDGVFFPDAVKGHKYLDDDVSKLSATYDRGLDRMFEIGMSIPTNKLSRSPAFRDAYWQRIGQLMPYMDEVTAKAAREGAAGAKMEAIMKGATTGRGRAPAVTTAANISDLRDVDTLAKAYAMETTRDLLYDLSNRHNISEAGRIIFPFLEAFGEVTSTWTRLMMQQWGRPFRRFQQVLESGRESNPFDYRSGYTNQGFFYENENGDEVFAAPFPVPGAGNFEYALSGLNIVGNVIPGVGPAIQTGASLFLPDDPKWDGIREAILPFGEGGNIVTSGLPSYLKRALSAFGPGRQLLGDANAERMYQNTVMDVLRSMALEDPARFKETLADPEANAAMQREAERKATQLYLVRSIATYLGPASPQYEFQTEDKDGQVWSFNALGAEYRTMLDDAEGDQLAAFNQFVGTFGLDPVPLIAPKTVAVQPRSLTGVGNAWQRAHPELFEQFPNVAYYLGPARFEEAADFDYGAYIRTIKEGTRKPLSAEEWQRVVNDFYGRLGYDKAKTDLIQARGVEDYDELDDADKNQLRYAKEQLRQQYPGYTPEATSGIAGIPERVDTATQISELSKLLQTRPDLVEDNPAMLGAAQYMAYRDEGLRQARLNGFATFAQAGKGDPQHVMFRFREILRRKGTELAGLYPDFQPLWENVLSREMADDAEALSTEEVTTIMAGPDMSNEEMLSMMMESGS